MAIDLPAAPRGRPLVHHKPLPERQESGRSHLGVTLPAPSQLRVRRIIHRGAPRPVSKFPSIKLGRSVHCESKLEVEVATLLDACPRVRWFGEQPVVLHFQQDGRQRYHIPDFILATPDHQEFVEVKFQRDIDGQVLERTALLQQLLQPYGYGYRLVSEPEIRRGHALANSKSLLLRGREVAPQLWALQTYEMIRQKVQPLARFGWNCPGQPEAGWIASEIMAGRLYVDLAQRLCSDSAVCLPLVEHREGQLWLSAASK